MKITNGEKMICVAVGMAVPILTHYAVVVPSDASALVACATVILMLSGLAVYIKERMKP